MFTILNAWRWATATLSERCRKVGNIFLRCSIANLGIVCPFSLSIANTICIGATWVGPPACWRSSNFLTLCISLLERHSKHVDISRHILMSSSTDVDILIIHFSFLVLNGLQPYLFIDIFIELDYFFLGVFQLFPDLFDSCLLLLNRVIIFGFLFLRDLRQVLMVEKSKNTVFFHLKEFP